MLTVAQAVGLVDEAVPLAKAAGWDQVGLQIGAPDNSVNLVAVCHEVTDLAVQAVQERGIDLVVTYHPLLFRPTTRFVAGATPSGRAYALAALGCSVVSVHTAFDAAPGGTADTLATTLGLAGVSGFGREAGAALAKLVVYVPEDAAAAVRLALADAGAGAIGQYRGCSFESGGVGRWTARDAAVPTVGEPGEAGSAAEQRIEVVAPQSTMGRVVMALLAAHPYEEPAYDVTSIEGYEGLIGRVGDVPPTTLEAFSQIVADRLAPPAIRVAGAGHTAVRRVAVLPGSGAHFMADAAAAGADVIVTGDVSHHRAAEATASGMAVIDAGHVPTERPGMEALVGLVAGWGVPYEDLTTLPSDPWHREAAEAGSLARRTQESR